MNGVVRNLTRAPSTLLPDVTISIAYTPLARTDGENVQRARAHSFSQSGTPQVEELEVKVRIHEKTETGHLPGSMS